MVIPVTPDLEAALEAAASRNGTTPELLALECLRQQFLVEPQRPASGEVPTNLAEFLSDYIGAVSSSDRVPGGAQMSQGTGQRFANGMAQKREEGRL